MRRPKAMVACALAHALTIGWLQASAPIPVSFEELAVSAESVFAGRVTRQESRFTEDRGLIITITTFEVDETLAGQERPLVQIVEYGGRVGDRVLIVSGQVVYRDGERVVVFACRDALGLARTCGAAQGRLELRAQEGVANVRGRIGNDEISCGLPELRERIEAARAVAP